MAPSFSFVDNLKRIVNEIDEKTFEDCLSVKLDCSTLVAIEKGESIGTVLKDFFDSLNKIKKPTLYWFEITSGHTPKEIIATARSAAAGIKRKFPLLNQMRKGNANTRILYAGKSFKIGERMIAHLGYHKKEDHHGLQLCHWAKEIGLQLQLHCLILPAKFSGLLDFFEDQLAKQLNPIIGKRRFL